MRNKKYIIIIIIALVIILAIVGCAATNQDETLNLIQNNQTIEIEVAIPENYEKEQGTQAELVWETLAYASTYTDTLRYPMEQVLGVNFDTEKVIKTGMLFETNDGESVQNNTLKDALQNNEFKAAVDNEDIISQISDIAASTFVDLDSDEEMTNFYMAINAYFNLLPGTEEGYANPFSTLTRAEFMTLVMRSETPVDTHYTDLNDEFVAAVGESKYNGYAQNLNDFAYLNTSDKSLNNQTYNGTISRAEAIYMLMNKYYADELAAVDTSKVTLDDTKDGGDIATAQDFAGKDYAKSYEIIYSINNLEAGVPTPIYKALALAESKGLIDSETRFDEAITLEESVELLVNIYKSLPVEGTTDSSLQFTPGEVTLDNGITFTYTEDGRVLMTVAQIREAKKIDPNFMEKIDMNNDGLTYENYKEKQANGTLTWEDMQNLSRGEMSEEEYNKRIEDGFLWGEEKTREDGTTYIKLDNGDEINYGDKMPDGIIYGGNAQDRWGK